jgi:uncharacterized membrane protein
MRILLVLIPVFIVEILTNSAWICVSYYSAIRNNSYLAYFLSILAGAFSGAAWCYMAKNTLQNDMFFMNILWDAIVSIIFISLPIVFFGVRLDPQTAIGTALAAIGLFIMHHD